MQRLLERIGERMGFALGAALLAAVAAAGVVAQHVAGGLGLGLAALAGAAAAVAVAAPALLAWRARVRQLNRATRALALGDFDAALPPQADDALGQLQRAWKRMRLAMEDVTSGLRDELGRQRSILDGMAEGVALLDEGEIVASNPAFGALLGVDARLEGRSLTQAAPGLALAEVVEASQRADEEVVRELTIGARALRVAARPLGGPARQTVVVLLDMTDARRVERLRRDFVANASHELRTPVAAILGAAETLAAGAADDAAARASFVAILGRHALRLSRLTADLLDLSRMEAGYPQRPERVAVADVADIVVGALRRRADERGVRLELGLPATALELNADRSAVEQILTNLVDNALKYTPAGGLVRVAAALAADDASAVELTVTDTGAGIAADHLPRLFERFYRVDAARSRELGGTGLGLAIVKHLVAANGGEVFVESEPGRGTRFRVRLPAAAAAAAPQSSQESHAAPGRAS